MAAQNKAAVVVAVVAAPVPAEDGGQSSEAGSAVDSAEELDDVRRAVRCLPLLSFSFLLPFLILFKYISIYYFLKRAAEMFCPHHTIFVKLYAATIRMSPSVF